jgi:hypothetical protein
MTKLKHKRNHFVHYGYIPGFGFYCFGFIHLDRRVCKVRHIDSCVNWLMLAPCLTFRAGLKLEVLRIKGDDTPISPGEFRDVDVPSGSDHATTSCRCRTKSRHKFLAGLMNQIIEEGRSVRKRLT